MSNNHVLLSQKKKRQKGIPTSCAPPFRACDHSLLLSALCESDLLLTGARRLIALEFEVQTVVSHLTWGKESDSGPLQEP